MSEQKKARKPRAKKAGGKKKEVSTKRHGLPKAQVARLLKMGAVGMAKPRISEKAVEATTRVVEHWLKEVGARAKIVLDYKRAKTVNLETLEMAFDENEKRCHSWIGDAIKIGDLSDRKKQLSKNPCVRLFMDGAADVRLADGAKGAIRALAEAKLIYLGRAMSILAKADQRGTIKAKDLETLLELKLKA